MHILYRAHGICMHLAIGMLSFSASMLLDRKWEGHLDCKKPALKMPKDQFQNTQSNLWYRQKSNRVKFQDTPHSEV